MSKEVCGVHIYKMSSTMAQLETGLGTNNVTNTVI